MRPFIALATAYMAAAIMIVTPAAPAGAAPLSDCTSHRGTIVAVDFAHWAGPIVRGCGIDQSSGYALLHAAGFTTAGDGQDGPAFICRLGDTAFSNGKQYPTPSEDACIVAPPANAYWSYWLAPAGQNRWTYSQLGAMSDVPKSGEVVLWTFGATNIGGTSGSGVPSLRPNTLRGQATATTMTATGTPSAPGKRSSGSVVVAEQPTRVRDSSGSAVPLLIGICLALALCGGAGWAAWRRRRYE